MDVLYFSNLKMTITLQQKPVLSQQSSISLVFYSQYDTFFVPGILNKSELAEWMKSYFCHETVNSHNRDGVDLGPFQIL